MGVNQFPSPRDDHRVKDLLTVQYLTNALVKNKDDATNPTVRQCNPEYTDDSLRQMPSRESHTPSFYVFLE